MADRPSARLDAKMRWSSRQEFKCRRRFLTVKMCRAFWSPLEEIADFERSVQAEVLPREVLRMPSSADLSNAALPAEPARAITLFDLTERQAGFVVTVMLHSGVFVGRQYAAFAGITHGQKVHDFIEKLLARRLVTAIKLGSTGRTRIFHVHHKPLYAAIGEPDNRNAGESRSSGRSSA
jgi:hypothetical protein